MDHKKFILELQKRTGLDKSRLNLLLKTTEEVMREQAINLNTVSLDGLGCLEPRKRLEFVHEEIQTGKKTLYPPRIVLHFTPDMALSDKIRKGENHE
ncbi:MAG: HU family DNA-binding protein [Bacteroidales bacterium]